MGVGGVGGEGCGGGDGGGFAGALGVARGFGEGEAVGGLVEVDHFEAGEEERAGAVEAGVGGQGGDGLVAGFLDVAEEVVGEDGGVESGPAFFDGGFELRRGRGCCG